jgi:aldose 1-epimerase
MSFHVLQEQRDTGGQGDGTIVVLEGAGGAARAEIAPGSGFNCFRWQVTTGGRTLDLLYADSNFLTGGKPTRSGIPILFPFPNRIRDGVFRWDGKRYQLPENGPGGKNAIHGFVCFRPWRVIASGADERSAWVTGEFRASVDAPETLSLWPTDYAIRITYGLIRHRLHLQAEIRNDGLVPLPFGLGFHPYFRIPAFGGEKPEDCEIEVPAGSFWELKDSLPTGARLPVAGTPLDLNRPRPFVDLKLDDLLTDIPDSHHGTLKVPRGIVHHGEGVQLVVRASHHFRETVVFTPPHRQAFCIEPYTCTTDAINLQQQGIDAGWRVLDPGQRSVGVEVKLAVDPL